VVHAARRRGKGRSRILYWFRTPPGVRVGRGPLDEEAIRLIEAGNPDLQFDWTRILKGQPAQEGPLPERREQPRDRERHAPAEPQRRVPTPRAPVQTPPPPDPVPVDEPTTAAHARLGSEGLARLRGRYSEVRTRIRERIPEPDRQEELNAVAERLNPDGWVTDAEVTGALESYEATFASLRAALGHQRAANVDPGPESQ
jgi:hypothetical protein